MGRNCHVNARPGSCDWLFTGWESMKMTSRSSSSVLHISRPTMTVVGPVSGRSEPRPAPHRTTAKRFSTMRVWPVVVACAFVLASSVARADVLFSVDVAGAASTKAKPLVINVFNAGGVAFTANVTDINKGDTVPLKALKVANAISQQTPFKASPRDLGGGKFDNPITIKGTNRVRIGPDPTMEGLNKINMGLKGLEFVAAFGGSGSAIGTDPSGGTSVVRAGIDGIFVDEIHPATSESFGDVLKQVDQDLKDHQIKSSYDPNVGVLQVSGIPGDQDFVFGNTDTGFETFLDAAAVPEPTPLSLLGVMLAFGGAIEMVRRRSRSVRGQRAG